MRDFLPGNRAKVVALVFGCVFIALMYMLGQYLAANSPCDQEADVAACWDDYYQKVVGKKGSRAALADLKVRSETDETLRAMCHPLVHLIGAAASREYESIGRAFEHGDSFCRAGYYHGVLEGVFGEGEEIRLSSLDGICRDIPGRARYSYEYFSCVHGVGHGLMAYFDGDLFESLKGCDGLTPDWERHSCYGGVFMENVISSTPEEPSEFLKDDDPLYPCTAVEGRYRTDCYMMQSSHMLTIFNGDFDRTFAVCETADSAYRRICFESVGRDASGYSGGSAESALALCMIGQSKEAQERCIVGAAVDFVQSVSVEGARGLCSISGAAERVCMEAVSIQAGML